MIELAAFCIIVWFVLANAEIVIRVLWWLIKAAAIVAFVIASMVMCWLAWSG